MKNKKIKEYIINENIDMEKIINDFARIYIYNNKKKNKENNFLAIFFLVL